MTNTATAVDLSVELGPLKLRSPVVAASGTFGYGDEFADRLELDRLGAVVTKTVTCEPRAGNAPHRTVETPSGMLNSIGLANPSGTSALIHTSPSSPACSASRG